MKPVLTAILAILYLATSAGATVTIHYCMGEAVSSSMVKKDKCGKCGMVKKDGCCEDKVQVVKTQDDHSFHSGDISFTPFIAALQVGYIIPAPAVASFKPVLTTHNNSPPGLSGILLCILHCVFRV